MKNKLHRTEKIIRILRHRWWPNRRVGLPRAQYLRTTFYRWRKKYGDIDLADARRLKELEKENAELKKMLAESILENRVFKEVNSKKW